MVIVFFFFQAEDGIRDIGVTGVQTCALPILAVLCPPCNHSAFTCICAYRRRKASGVMPSWRLNSRRKYPTSLKPQARLISSRGRCKEATHDRREECRQGGYPGGDVPGPPPYDR